MDVVCMAPSLHVFDSVQRDQGFDSWVPAREALGNSHLGHGLKDLDSVALIEAATIAK